MDQIDKKSSGGIFDEPLGVRLDDVDEFTDSLASFEKHSPRRRRLSPLLLLLASLIVATSIFTGLWPICIFACVVVLAVALLLNVVRLLKCWLGP